MEVDLTKPLVLKFKLKHGWRMIMYEGMQMICFQCSMYGHNKESCSKFSKAGHGGQCAEQDPADKMTGKGKIDSSVSFEGREGSTRKENISGGEIHGNYGPWMIVERRPRKYDNKKEKGLVRKKRG